MAIIIKKSVFVFLCIASTAFGRPQNTLSEVLEEVAEDMTQAVKSKAGVVTFVGGAASNVASMAGNAAVDYVSAIDVEASLNDTEEAIINNKVALIENVFDAKRQVIRAMGAAKDEHAETVSAFINSTIDSINMAIAATQEGVSVTKTFAADVAAEMTVENAQDAVLSAYQTTYEVLESTTTALITTLVSAKEQLQEAASNFDSQSTIHDGKVNLGVAINATVSGAEMYAQQAGVFNAVDNLIHGVADLPNKINGFLASTIESMQEETAEDASVEIEDMEEEPLDVQPRTVEEEQQEEMAEEAEKEEMAEEAQEEEIAEEEEMAEEAQEEEMSNIVDMDDIFEEKKDEVVIQQEVDFPVVISLINAVKEAKLLPHTFTQGQLVAMLDEE